MGRLKLTKYWFIYLFILLISFNQKSFALDFSGKLDQLSNLYLLAEVNLEDFDHELNQALENGGPFLLEESSSYKKMVAIWGIRHQLQDEVISSYLSLSQTALNKNSNNTKKKLAQMKLFNLKKKLDSADDLERLALDDLRSELIRLNHQNEIKTLDKKLPEFSIFSLRPSFENEMGQVLLLRNFRSNLKMQKRTWSLLDNNEMNLRIEAAAAKIKFSDSNLPSTKRNDLLLYPSVGQSGNIVGGIFPKNTWALTYDDGPHPVHTPNIVKNLKQLGIEATFFWLAENVLRYQSIVELVKENNSSLQNHSWSHAQLTKLDDEKLLKEIKQSTLVETKAYGKKPEFFRCPYGAGTSVNRVRKMISDNGMIHVFWNVDSLDWQDKDPDSILLRAKKQMKAQGRGVVLFHDVHSQSVIASKKLVEWTNTLKNTVDEVRWVTMPEIVREINEAQK